MSQEQMLLQVLFILVAYFLGGGFGFMAGRFSRDRDREEK